MSFWSTMNDIGGAINGVGSGVMGVLGLSSQTQKLGGAEDYGFYDYGNRMAGTYDQVQNEMNFNRNRMGKYAGQVGNVQSSFNPQSYMNQFLGSTEGLANAVSGPNSQLQQSLNAIASRQAAEGVNAQAQNFAGMGALNSGAAMAAMGDAMANPYAQVQAQLQQNQLQGTLGLMGNAMNNYAQGNQFGAQNALQAGMANQNANMGLAQLYGQGYGNAMNQFGNLGNQFGTIVAPTYQQKNGWGQDLLGAAGDVASIAGVGKKAGLWG